MMPHVTSFSRQQSPRAVEQKSSIQHYFVYIPCTCIQHRYDDLGREGREGRGEEKEKRRRVERRGEERGGRREEKNPLK